MKGKNSARVYSLGRYYSVYKIWGNRIYEEGKQFKVMLFHNM